MAPLYRYCHRSVSVLSQLTLRLQASAISTYPTSTSVSQINDLSGYVELITETTQAEKMLVK